MRRVEEDVSGVYSNEEDITKSIMRDVDSVLSFICETTGLA